MTEARPATGLLVSALIRRIEAEGGHGMVIARGDATAGAMLLLIADRGVEQALIERMPGIDGYRWAEAGPPDADARRDYLARRRNSDPDLWVVELDHPQARELTMAMLS